jgi:hypothetical protein
MIVAALEALRSEIVRCGELVLGRAELKMQLETVSYDV